MVKRHNCSRQCLAVSLSFSLFA